MAEVKYVSQANLSRILGKIKETYVVKETGKGLSTNDLTNELLAKINGMGSVATLNEIGESNLSADLKAKVNAAAEGNHSHANKALLDTYTQTEENLADAVAKKHAHANAEELNKIAAGDKAKWDGAVSDVADIKADYLKGADKTELSNSIKGVSDRVGTIESDYLKQADKYDDTVLAGRVTTVEGKVTTLIGEDANKSVRSIAAEELAAKLIPGNAAESMNELTEIAAWIQSHPGDAAAMNAAILALQKQLQGIDAGEGTVKTYVDGAISALKIGDYAKAAELTALASRVTTAEGKITTLEGASHTHSNKAELDKIAEGDKAKWDAVAADYVKASELVAFTDAEIDEVWANA